MKTLPPLFIFVLFAFTSFSQGLEIYIDATTGKSTFVSGKDTLEKPQVKRGESIDLYLLNYNNYLYEIEIEESQRQTVYATGMDTSQLSGLSKSPGGGSALDLMSVIMNPAWPGMNPLAQGQLSFLGGLLLRVQRICRRRTGSPRAASAGGPGVQIRRGFGRAGPDREQPAGYPAGRRTPRQCQSHPVDGHRGDP